MVDGGYLLIAVLTFVTVYGDFSSLPLIIELLLF
jgi:hypothetical protein